MCRKKPRADYTAKVIEDVLVIEDLDSGEISVTNDIENILCYEQEQTGHSWVNKHIIYKDSDENWDQVKWNGRDVRFVSLSEGCMEEQSLSKALARVKQLPTLFM